jgi:hypothetical protein
MLDIPQRLVEKEELKKVEAKEKVGICEAQC